MSSYVAKLPPSLATNKFAIGQAKALDAKSNALTKAKEVGSRPSRMKRGMSTLAGGGGVGLIAGMVENKAVKGGIAAAAAIGGAVAGIVFDSDILFDAGMGAGAVATFHATEAITSAARAAVLGDDDDTEGVEPDATAAA